MQDMTYSLHIRVCFVTMIAPMRPLHYLHEVLKLYVYTYIYAGIYADMYWFTDKAVVSCDEEGLRDHKR